MIVRGADEARKKFPLRFHPSLYEVSIPSFSAALILPFSPSLSSGSRLGLRFKNLFLHGIKDRVF